MELARELHQRALGIDAASTTSMHNRWVLLLKCMHASVRCLFRQRSCSVLHQRALGIDDASATSMHYRWVLLLGKWCMQLLHVWGQGAAPAGAWY